MPLVHAPTPPAIDVLSMLLHTPLSPNSRPMTPMYATAAMLLWRCSEKLDDAQVEDLLERVVQLFTFVTDKDLFGDIYRCASSYHERDFVLMLVSVRAHRCTTSL
jgi:hypothetical protein